MRVLDDQLRILKFSTQMNYFQKYSLMSGLKLNFCQPCVFNWYISD